MRHMTIFIAAVFFSSGALAEEAQVLARQKACLGCHDIERHTMAVPSYRKVSEKYRDQQDGLDYIKNKIRNGGQGVWGGHMPAFPTLTDKEISTLAEWIIGLSK